VRQGTIVFVAQGAINGTAVFRITTADPITIDSTSIAFASMGLLSTPVPLSSGGSGAASAISALSNFGVIQVTAEAGTNTITGTIDALVTAYRADQLFILVPANDNTGAATFNPTPSGGAALGAKNIFFNGAALTAGELMAGVPVLLQYDGTQFNIIGNSPLVATGAVDAAGDILIATAANTIARASGPITPINCQLTYAVAANALTITLKGQNGSDLSASNPALIPFRNATLATGDYTWIALTANQTLTVSSGSTLGAVANQAFRLWVVGFNDGGTFRLGVIKTVTTVAGVLNQTAIIHPLAAWGAASSTAEGGAGGADSARVFYTGTAVIAKAYTTLGYATWDSGLAVIGTWDVGPTRVQPYTQEVPLPGRHVQHSTERDGELTTGTTTIPADDTIPTSTEGDLYLSVSISPSAAANLIHVRATANFGHSAAIGQIISFLQEGTTTFATAVYGKQATANLIGSGVTYGSYLAATTAQHTLSYRAGSSTAGTMTFNGSAGARLYGGSFGSRIDAWEIMT
jgi:hypothetical protein